LNIFLDEVFGGNFSSINLILDALGVFRNFFAKSRLYFKKGFMDESVLVRTTVEYFRLEQTVKDLADF
jgi:hypothetical protein